MRDLIIAFIVFGALPFILQRPFYGVIMLNWLGLMNPHKLCWGFAVHMPFVQVTFLVTLLGFLFSRERARLPLRPEIVLLFVFLAWMLFSTFYAVYPEPAWDQFNKLWRILLTVVLTLLLTNNRERIIAMVWTAGLSLGFYGIKGGIWTIIHGGVNRVYGPAGGFISGNNEIGLALLMTAPLLWFLATHQRRGWLRLGLYLSVVLTLIAVVGTQSRGAFLGLAAMGLMMFIKARRKFLPLVIGVSFAVLLPVIVPEAWFERMHTIKSYEEDSSAMGRINAWKRAVEIANHHLTGGGFEVLVYGHEHDAHSIYFKVLAEHGYPALAMFLAILLLSWWRAGRIRRLSQGRPELAWASELAAMIQVSLTGYMTAGAFLGLCYFDFYYILVALLISLDVVVSDLTQPARQAVRPRPQADPLLAAGGGR